MFCFLFADRVVHGSRFEWRISKCVFMFICVKEYMVQVVVQQVFGVKRACITSREWRNEEREREKNKRKIQKNKNYKKSFVRVFCASIQKKLEVMGALNNRVWQNYSTKLLHRMILCICTVYIST